ncbi:MAG: 2-polyprenyl-3-methyl-6-methoxy-1,4-benzoquinone monooxygenase [Caldimonas sp.]
MDPISLTPADRVLAGLDQALRSITGTPRAARSRPTAAQPDGPLDDAARRQSGALMRVNHVGEVCAQALYSAQALATPNPELRRKFADAAGEETDHLAWTAERLRELGARPSLLNPLWYLGAFGIGLVAGRMGDAASLGFVVETERQVEQHLASHLDRLPQGDLASRAIVGQMKDDEAGHARSAESAGAARLPWPVRMAMRVAGRVMTTTAHYV